MHFSIIVCTYNSISRIEKTLEHLSEIVVDDSSMVELILVDNNSADGTLEFIVTTWTRLGEPYCLKILVEKRQGLFWARTTGISNSNGDVLIFCDDDNWLPASYLCVVGTTFNENHNIGVVGTESEAVFPEDFEPPKWFFENSNAFAVGKQFAIDGIVKEGKMVWGAGMALRGDVIRRILLSNFPFKCSGRVGSDIISGDDAEICACYLLLGFELYYTSSICIKHQLPIERLDFQYLESLQKSFVLAANKLAPIWLIIDLKQKYRVKRNKYLAVAILLVKLLFNNYKMARFWVEVYFIFPGFAINWLLKEYVEIIEAENRFNNKI